MLLQTEEHAENNRLKFHFKKRFRLAWLAAKELQKVGETRLDAFSQIEVEAYVAHFGALFMMENKQHQEALDNLIKCKVIYEKISQYKDTLEAIIYQEKIS